jgi:hypothetical protein
MENIENKSLCAKATLIEKAMNSFNTNNAQYILYNKDDKNISMFEVTKPYSTFAITKSVTTNPANQVTPDNIDNTDIVYYKIVEVNDGEEGGVCVKAVGDEGPTETGKYVVIKQDNTPMIVTISTENGKMVNEAEEEEDKKTVKPAEGNKYYKIQGDAGKVTAVDPAAVVPENGEIGEQLDVKNAEQVAAAVVPENGEIGEQLDVKNAEQVATAAAANKADEDAAAAGGNDNADPNNRGIGQGGDGASGQGGARKKKRRNPTKKGRKSGKKGRKSGKKSRKARRSRRSKK